MIRNFIGAVVKRSCILKRKEASKHDFSRLLAQRYANGTVDLLCLLQARMRNAVRRYQTIDAVIAVMMQLSIAKISAIAIFYAAILGLSDDRA